MHTSYAPDEITEYYIENCCDDLRCALVNVLDNEDEYQEEMYDDAVAQIKHISALLDAMMPE